MNYLMISPIWQTVRQKFYQTVEKIPDQDLTLQVGSSTVASLIRHNAEVEYMFADWYFGKPLPDHMQSGYSGDTVAELLELLEGANAHLLEAMAELPDDAWHRVVESRMGPSTPLEAIGRLIYHTGIHVGQISLIRSTQQAAPSQVQH